MSSENTQLLKIQDKQGFIHNGEINYFGSGWPNCTLEFTSLITEKLSFTEQDLFECLTQLRLELAKYGYKLLCAGARLDVYPSGMDRDMGCGQSAQVIGSGHTGDLKDVQHIGIFDYAEPDLIASVEEQFNYYISTWNYSYEFMIKHDSGSIIEGVISGNSIVDKNKIKFTSTVTPDIEVIGTNTFQCLINFRTELEKYNYQPLCNGARIDTYILPTDLDDDGSWLHILIPGKLPNPEDSVYTFDDANPDLIASIGEQRRNYESWLNSIKSIPISEYKEYEISNLPELYFRLIKIGDLLLMWLFDIDSSMYKSIDIQVERAKDSDELKILRALSPLSPEQVEKLGSLKSEAIIGFITGEQLSLEYFRPNRIFIDFMQNIIGIEAPKDTDLKDAALKQQEGWIYIMDRRIADNPQEEETSPEDILGAFEIKDGQILANSYQPNDNYLIFGKNGLFQLPDSLNQALISALEAL